MAIDFPNSPTVGEEYTANGVRRVWDGEKWNIATSDPGNWGRATATITTASLADAASEDGTVGLTSGYRLLQVTTDRACRVRLYTTSAKRTADAARAIGTDPTGDHGLMLEFVATGAVTDYDLSPTVDGFCPTGTTVYYAVENKSGGASTVAVTFDYVRTE